jgi:hypothetical protein
MDIRILSFIFCINLLNIPFHWFFLFRIFKQYLNLLQVLGPVGDFHIFLCDTTIVVT